VRQPNHLPTALRPRGCGSFQLWVILTGRGADDPLLVKKAFREVLESIEVRIAAVREFLELFKRGIKYDIVPIADVYGPTASDPNIQALIVSKETVSGANASELIQISCETYPYRVHDVHMDVDLLFDFEYSAWLVTDIRFIWRVQLQK